MSLLPPMLEGQKSMPKAYSPAEIQDEFKHIQNYFKAWILILDWTYILI